LHLAHAGHDVVVNYHRNQDAAERIVQSARAAGVRAVAVQGDVASEEDVHRLFSSAQETLGAVTGLVNNAGATLHIGDLADTPVAVVREVIDVNLVGVILCARRAAQQMSTSRGGAGGAIVNVSSAAATLGSPHEYVHYAAAKAGIDALTIGLSKELARDGIRVNAVAAGIVRTDIHAAAGDPDRADRAAAAVSRSDGRGSRRRSPRPSVGCWGRRRPMSPARSCASPVASRWMGRRAEGAAFAGSPANGLFDTPAVTAYKTAEGHLNSRFTSRADLADSMLRQLTSGQYVRKTMAVATVEVKPSLLKLIWREGISKSMHRTPRPSPAEPRSMRRRRPLGLGSE
jgi:glucose 1-dehydrogenase